VENITVCPWLAARLASSINFRQFFLSSPVVGSSKITISGQMEIADKNATLWRSPLERE
jgi:hypothetical protein